MLRRITCSTTLPGSRAGYDDGYSADGYEIQIGTQLVRASAATNQFFAFGRDVIRAPSSEASRACSDVDERRMNAARTANRSLGSAIARRLLEDSRPTPRNGIQCAAIAARTHAHTSRLMKAAPFVSMLGPIATLAIELAASELTQLDRTIGMNLTPAIYSEGR